MILFIVVIGNAAEQTALDTITTNRGMFVRCNVNTNRTESDVRDTQQLKLIQRNNYSYGKEDLFGGRYVWKNVRRSI